MGTLECFLKVLHKRPTESARFSPQEQSLQEHQELLAAQTNL